MSHKIVGLLIVLFSIVSPHDTHAKPQNYVVSEFKADSKVFKPTVKGGLGGEISDLIGIKTFFLITGGWAEAYIGPTISLGEHLTLGLSCGIESTDGRLEPRFETSVKVIVDDFSFTGILEWGTDGDKDLWYKVISTYKLTPWLKVGVEGRRFAGLSPHVSVAIPEIPVHLWASWIPWNVATGEITIERTMFGITLIL
ncbi:MAG: hypothetical protein CO029_02710 [Candidatus Magasanikbacteria bacterium CG_4_9_14_0_2_um_filter_41_10]|uniref:Outer membrane protein beta-barrel domain-containing protein n=1 Tax=Candidatus Magasanikbacteria bacterium CG_4_10_14_0_2_um_filter_41_31 TaxID=1974639 RepID=A0A2M7V2X9_9BACT|nr:MAG: hypothetical protein AUJ37_03785 [Candidatus Magasanikbacteria bacterium CG1_02_41_34]PIZ92818.1 MAG: hypothetical protein COX83_03470 [Candidatus Magasanikbacteria bacterium CG_4_10_14_0_2_um_filter_41_31]PJC53446.1 MAG: hypothetical protein CO029_02710 [Candidatus Magasanikbacteria bacterium CG_4_9_14_0_2_um_filter_41_10]